MGVTPLIPADGGTTEPLTKKKTPVCSFSTPSVDPGWIGQEKLRCRSRDECKRAQSQSMTAAVVGNRLVYLYCLISSKGSAPGSTALSGQNVPCRTARGGGTPAPWVKAMRCRLDFGVDVPRSSGCCCTIEDGLSDMTACAAVFILGCNFCCVGCANRTAGRCSRDGLAVFGP